MVPVPEWNRFPHSFGHIFAGGYAAGYYSYKWAEVLAADAFAAFEESGVFDRPTAQRFLDAILSRGGSRDALDAFIEFRGRSPDVRALLKQHGILGAGSGRARVKCAAPAASLPLASVRCSQGTAAGAGRAALRRRAGRREPQQQRRWQRRARRALKSGDRVELIERAGEAVHVRLADGREGWLRVAVPVGR